jgi:uncharacterized protein YqeY
VADTRRIDFDEHFAGSSAVENDSSEDERFTGFVGDCGWGLHPADHSHPTRLAHVFSPSVDARGARSRALWQDAPPEEYFMSLRAKIEADLKQAMLQKNESAKNALRMLKSELLLEEVKLGRELTDKEGVAIVQRSLKMRRDSLEQYRASGRTDIVEEEEKELAIVEQFAPKNLGEDELRASIAAIVAELGLAGKKDMGRLMKELQARHESFDGKVASKLAGDLLG